MNTQYQIEIKQFGYKTATKKYKKLTKKPIKLA